MKDGQDNSAAVATQWKRVPVEPTLEMCAAGRHALDDGPSPAMTYRAMIAAAPTPPNEDELVAAIKAEAATWTGDARGAVFLALSELAKRIGVRVTKHELWAIGEANYRARKGEQG